MVERQWETCSYVPGQYAVVAEGIRGGERKLAIEKVKAYFKEYGMEKRVQEFDVSSATVELAAAALHCEPQRIAKTLSFMVDGHAVQRRGAGIYWNRQGTVAVG